jgi:hypothetical protein
MIRWSNPPWMPSHNECQNPLNSYPLFTYLQVFERSRCGAWWRNTGCGSLPVTTARLSWLIQRARRASCCTTSGRYTIETPVSSRARLCGHADVSAVRTGKAEVISAIPGDGEYPIICHSANRGIARTSTSMARASIHQYRIFSGQVTHSLNATSASSVISRKCGIVLSSGVRATSP